MPQDDAVNLHKILIQDTRSRVEQRDEFFEAAMAGLTKSRAQLARWVTSDVFFGFNGHTEKFRIEEVVEQIELKVLECLLNQLDGKPQHPDLNLGMHESLFQYCKRLAIRNNIPRDARKEITVH